MLVFEMSAMRRKIGRRGRTCGRDHCLRQMPGQGNRAAPERRCRAGGQSRHSQCENPNGAAAERYGPNFGSKNAVGAAAGQLACRAN